MNRSAYTILLVAFGTLLSVVPAGAAAPAAAGDELQEVVITARQRNERVLDVPITVEAFTAADIEAAGIRRPVDFIALTPGVSAVQTAEVGDLQVSMRGINTGRDAEPNFALVVDGVLQTSSFSLNQELANVQQIEVLKGPQGAVYGRNAVAGAIIMTTRKPGADNEFSVGLSYGNRATEKANLWLAGPLSSTVSAGVEVYDTKTSGLFDNSYLKCDNCVDKYREYGIVPRLVFKTGDNGTAGVCRLPQQP